VKLTHIDMGEQWLRGPCGVGRYRAFVDTWSVVAPCGRHRFEADSIVDVDMVHRVPDVSRFRETYSQRVRSALEEYAAAHVCSEMMLPLSPGVRVVPLADALPWWRRLRAWIAARVGLGD